MKGHKLYIGIASVLLLGYLLVQYNRPKAVNWDQTLRKSDKIPYGTYVLHGQLTEIYPRADVINTNKSAYEIFQDSVTRPGNYLMIAKSVSIGKNDFKQMLKYIKAGNSVFISAMDIDGFIADTLKVRIQSEYGKNTPTLNFTNPQLNKKDGFEFDNSISNDYFAKFDRTKAIVLAKNQNGNAAYLRYTYGKGNLYLFANPLTLSNYGILNAKGGGYGAIALSYLPMAKNVYWDQYQNHDIDTDQSELRVLFEYPALQWAYYLAIISLLLFVAYEVKRRQRIIPVIEPLKNASLEFVKVVGKVYYEQRDNNNIAAKKILYFSEHIRTTFGIKMGDYQPPFIKAFADKTGVEYALAEKLINHIGFLSGKEVIMDHELIVLNQLIEKFYIQSGSYGK